MEGARHSHTEHLFGSLDPRGSVNNIRFVLLDVILKNLRQHRSKTPRKATNLRKILRRCEDSIIADPVYHFQNVLSHFACSHFGTLQAASKKLIAKLTTVVGLNSPKV